MSGYRSVAAYDPATNAYAQVIASPWANISARSQAQIGLGLVLEKQAALTTGTNQTVLLQMALDNDLDVFYGSNQRDGETADPFWLKKAGLQAAPLVGMLNDPKKEMEFYKSLEQKLPQLTDSLEKKIAALPPGKN